MSFTHQIPRLLDEEHHAQLALMNKLEQALVGSNGITVALAAELVRLLDGEAERHFAFEEAEIFPRLEEFGAGDISRLLRSEHEDIRALGSELLPAARSAAASGGGSAALRQLALELVERQISHIQKETLGLLPLVDDLLDDETDRALAMAYAAG